MRDLGSKFSCNPNIFLELGSQDPPLFPALIPNDGVPTWGVITAKSPTCQQTGPFSCHYDQLCWKEGELLRAPPYRWQWTRPSYSTAALVAKPETLGWPPPSENTYYIFWTPPAQSVLFNTASTSLAQRYLLKSHSIDRYRITSSYSSAMAPPSS